MSSFCYCKINCHHIGHFFLLVLFIKCTKYFLVCSFFLFLLVLLYFLFVYLLCSFFLLCVTFVLLVFLICFIALVHLPHSVFMYKHVTDFQYRNASDYNNGNNYFWFKRSYQLGASVVQKHTASAVHFLVTILAVRAVVVCVKNLTFAFTLLFSLFYFFCVFFPPFLYFLLFFSFFFFAFPSYISGVHHERQDLLSPCDEMHVCTD